MPLKTKLALLKSHLKLKLASLKSKIDTIKYQYRHQAICDKVDKLPQFSDISQPYVFTSTLCREQHFRMPLYTYWCRRLGEVPRFHRKQWEYVFICQVLNERGYLRPELDAIGFGVGKEPLTSLFASYGINVLATDLDTEKATSLGWVASNQHSTSLVELNQRGLCDHELFKRRAKFQTVDMNNIPENLGTFDICWSSCAFEHLGSIRNGLDFVYNSLKLIKPGGIAVHTTEFNLSSNDKTLDHNPSFVIYRKRDIEQFVQELKMHGYIVEPVDYVSGEDKLGRYIDLPPYSCEPHLRLQLANQFVSTSIGLIIRVPEEMNKVHV